MDAAADTVLKWPNLPAACVFLIGWMWMRARHTLDPFAFICVPNAEKTSSLVKVVVPLSHPFWKIVQSTQNFKKWALG